MKIIIVLSKLEDAKKIRKILISHGFSDAVPCNTASAALIEANTDARGLVISGCRLPDMHYSQLKDCLPAGYEFLLIGSANAVSTADSSIMSVTMPIRVYDLVNTVEMILNQAERLMERNHLSEEEAYRYIQKRSMDNGTNMVETAQMILTLMYDEC